MDIGCTTSSGNFSLRSAALVISDNRLLVARNDKYDCYYTVGGGIRENEPSDKAIIRELYEETGALEFDIESICVYSVTAPDNFNGKESFGMLFFADIKRFEEELHSEIEKIVITSELPERWTYPDIQPYLMKEAKKRGYL